MILSLMWSKLQEKINDFNCQKGNLKMFIYLSLHENNLNKDMKFASTSHIKVCHIHGHKLQREQEFDWYC